MSCKLIAIQPSARDDVYAELWLCYGGYRPIYDDGDEWSTHTVLMWSEEREMVQALQYKGYIGSVLYSAEDKMLHGRVLGVRDMISFGGAGVRSLDKNFRDAVDEYLRFCKAEGKTPDVPLKGSFNVRISPDLHRRASLYAEGLDLKLNAVVQRALKEYLTHAE